MTREGSGTTGHAVLELNREDGETRTFTLVTNNENNIGENITYERLYRINNGKGTNGKTQKTLKITSISMKCGLHPLKQIYNPLQSSIFKM
ncbi:hypothetical protein ACJA23_01485 [Mycoplasma corogypsi]|uniref:hypothetical protein n=1 Tax=Mycoplasma corogypsi TaxID=2106 RepID=UPI003872DC65